MNKNLLAAKRLLRLDRFLTIAPKQSVPISVLQCNDALRAIGPIVGDSGDHQLWKDWNIILGISFIADRNMLKKFHISSKLMNTSQRFFVINTHHQRNIDLNTVHCRHLQISDVTRVIHFLLSKLANKNKKIKMMIHQFPKD